MPSVNTDECSNDEVRVPILYRDEHLVVVYKPSGLLVHRSPIDRLETQFVMQVVRDQIGHRVFTVHRLDKPTSGILLFALSSAAANEMMLKFQAGQVRKQYVAIVRGCVTTSGTIDYALSDEPDRVAEPKARRDRPAQAAVTHYHALADVELNVAVSRYPTSRYSLLSLQPENGRRHQLRRHLRHIFHPIIGDTTHGEGRHNRFFRTEFNCHRLLLAATGMQFEHPFTEQLITINSLPDITFTRVSDALGWRERLDNLAPIAEPST